MKPGFDSILFPQEDFLRWSGMEGLRSACLGMTLLDIEALGLCGNDFFTFREAEKASQMGSRRLRSFTATRAALKMLARQVGLVGRSKPDSTIETLSLDGVKPCLGESKIYCSASHSARFVAAVAHRYPIGVDIEGLSIKFMRSRHIFLRPTEQNLISPSELSPERIVTRLWTTKEAAAKALGLQLFDAFREVEVMGVGENEGVWRYQKKTFQAKHAEGNGQVVTLVSVDAS